MIGIIVAEPKELDAVKNYMKNIIVEEKYGLQFHVGDIGNRRFVVTLCGMGKVNAARTTQSLIDNYNPDYVINCGVAGGLSDVVKIGDIVVGEKLVQYDYDITAFGRELGEISNIVGRYIHSDKTLVEKAYGVIVRDDSISGLVGTIATADRFVTDPNESKRISVEFGADCCEMEGAAVAQVCYLDNIPFIVIRSISDIPNNDNKVDYDEFIKIAADNVARFIVELVK